MKLATYKDGTIDGALVVVSKDHRFAVSASNIAPIFWLLCGIGKRLRQNLTLSMLR